MTGGGSADSGSGTGSVVASIGSMGSAAPEDSVAAGSADSTMSTTSKAGVLTVTGAGT